MDLKGNLLKRGTVIKSQATSTGAVHEYTLGANRRLYQITTFCPDKAGSGPTNLIKDDALILVDTGVPTSLVKTLTLRPIGLFTLPRSDESVLDLVKNPEVAALRF
jgi:hypothetical protein